MAVMTMIDDGEEKEEKKQKTDRQVNQLCPYKEAGEQRQWRHNQGKILAHSQYSTAHTHRQPLSARQISQIGATSCQLSSVRKM